MGAEDIRDDEPIDEPIDGLRARRAQARKAAELARLRSRGAEGAEAGAGAPSVEQLEAEVRALTDALIARYATDLTLVDSLLGPAYPAKVTREGRA